MKVVLSTIGKYHMFNLAAQLLARGDLARLISSYPAFETRKYGIPNSYVRSIVTKEIAQRGWAKMPPLVRNAYNPTYAIHRLFDELASRSLVPADIFSGTSSSSLKTLRRAKRMGMRTIIERASAHILSQDEILREEYARQGVTPPSDRLPDPRIMDLELTEYEETDYISVPSAFVERTMRDHGIPDGKIIRVPYGVDLEHFRRIPKNDEVFRVIFAGNMSFQKGTPYLLQAFHELRLPNSELLLVGSATEEIRPFFKKYAGSFTFIGHVPQTELYKEYSRSSVFVMPSVQDGFGLVIAQAMACGLPVIASEHTGGPDIIEEGVEGFIVPIRSVEKLKEKLTYLYEHPDILERMGQAAAERAARGFSWDNYGEKMVAEYERILK